MTDSRKYQEMLTEVEAIVQDVSSPNIDLDDLVDKVQRGYQVIQVMKTRLAETKTMIEELHNQHQDEKQ